MEKHTNLYKLKISRKAFLTLAYSFSFTNYLLTSCKNYIKKTKIQKPLSQELLKIQSKIKLKQFLSFTELANLSENSSLFSTINKLLCVNNTKEIHSLKAEQYIYRGNTKTKRIAFSIDCGGGADDLPETLDILKVKNVSCTFFITGKFMEKFPDLVLRMVVEGHEIGNHTYNHLEFKSVKQAKKEILTTQEKFYNLTRKQFAPYLRFPYYQAQFSNKKWLVKVAAKLGYLCVNSSIDTNDWATRIDYRFIPYKQFVQKCKHIDFSKLGFQVGRKKFSFCKSNIFRIKNSHSFNAKGAIYIFHAGSERKSKTLVLSLAELIDFYRSKGYRPGSISSVLSYSENTDLPVM